MRPLALFILLAATPAIVASQGVTSQSRAQQVAAAFSKRKHVVEEKHGVRREKYKDVRSEPVVLHDITAYSGVYVTDLGDSIDLEIGSDGTIQATGLDAEPSARPFVLENARIDGAVLIATKRYRDGASERFEGVFMSRTERNAPTDPGITTFGLGVVFAMPREVAGNTYDKLFYQRQR